MSLTSKIKNKYTSYDQLITIVGGGFVEGGNSIKYQCNHSANPKMCVREALGNHLACAAGEIKEKSEKTLM